MEAEPSLQVVAAGDIADCDTPDDEATAELVKKYDGPVLLLGDTVYERGTPKEFAECFDPSWGAFKSRLRPAPGNHEYAGGKAEGYFQYFGDAAGPSGRGYYSFDVGGWHVVSLNSNCSLVSCAAGSDQEKWLRNNLASSKAKCTLAYAHHPRFSSGLHGSTREMAPLYQALYDHSADIFMAGHDHHYERFAPLDPHGRVNVEKGLRNFVVGTGGRKLYPAIDIQDGSEQLQSTFGVIVLTLNSDGFRWEFLSTNGNFRDEGSAKCH